MPRSGDEGVAVKIKTISSSRIAASNGVLCRSKRGLDEVVGRAGEGVVGGDDDRREGLRVKVQLLNVKV